MDIRIIKRPRGEAPEYIRDAWVGLLLPVASGCDRPVNGRGFGVLSMPKSWLGRRFKRLFGDVPRRRGYPVETAKAVALLERTNPTAAAWWRTNAPHLFRPGLILFFDAECCTVEGRVDRDSDEPSSDFRSPSCELPRKERYGFRERHILRGARAAVANFDHPLREFFPDGDAIRNANQVRVLKFHARPFVAIVE